MRGHCRWNGIGTVFMKRWKMMATALAMACLLTGCWQEELPEEPEDVLPLFEEEPAEESKTILPV